MTGYHGQGIWLGRIVFVGPVGSHGRFVAIRRQWSKGLTYRGCDDRMTKVLVVDRYPSKCWQSMWTVLGVNKSKLPTKTRPDQVRPKRP
jgi:hypothetical protein